MTSFTIDTLRSIYFTNQPYRYPSPWLRKSTNQEGKEGGDFGPCINTGWHVIPNMLWGHVASPKQWWEMVIKYEAISVTGITCRIFNPIPIQTALSFQATGTFPAFNNTVYALTYTDELYETPWFPWHDKVYNGSMLISQFYEWNPEYKEGLIPNKKTDIYDQSNDCADKLLDLYDREDIYPKYYPTQITQNLPASYQVDTYRRQFLPIYWYHFPFMQYKKPRQVTAAWRQQITLFEEAWLDMSGAFWDPLNRPDSLGELRPGKNMIEYNWTAHPSDEGIWFNTDRVALPTPYPRPRMMQCDPGMARMTRVQACDPTAPGRRMFNQVEYLYDRGLLKPDTPATTAEDQMCPEGWSGLPNWRHFPIVPTRWFFKEMQQSNTTITQNVMKRYYKEQVTNCPEIEPLGDGIKKGDREITGPIEDIKFPGTEYEMYKYPPTQWFIKAIPLYDNKENHIPVEMQAFMHITVHVKGKNRRSALFAPSWGPVLPQDLYSVNMDTAFGENYIRGRSGGARRTWMDPTNTRPVRNVNNYEVLLEDPSGEVRTPWHPQYQCIIEPKTTPGYELPLWPGGNKAAYQDKRLKITYNVIKGSRHVRPYEQGAGKCYADGTCD